MLLCYLALAYLLLIPAGFLVHAGGNLLMIVLSVDLAVIALAMLSFIACWIRGFAYGKLIRLFAISLAIQLLIDFMGIVIGGVPLW